MKYKNKELAIKALSEDLKIWGWAPLLGCWMSFNVGTMLESDTPQEFWAVGDKPTRPPRKSRIILNGISFPAPILDYDDLPDPYWSVNQALATKCNKLYKSRSIARAGIGDFFATEAEAEETIRLRKKKTI